ncbi:MAG: hypothetical protein ACI9KE_006189 [Polyangiales bacterium]|jgi:hypothetical protein
MTDVMKRVFVSVLASTFVVVGLSFMSNDADAQRRRQRRQAPPAEQTPTTDAIAGAMGAIEWGWSKEQLVEHFTKQLRAEYRPRIHKARDAMSADQMRVELRRKVRRIRDSFVEFNGRTSGHDTGFLRDEFSHRNEEAMVRVRGDNADDYYFFIQGRLWKWYRAFDSSVFAGADFEQFSAALSNRFGAPGRSRTGRIIQGGDERTWLEWQDDSTRLRALDNNQFYGFYCIVFEHKGTLENLETLRRNPPRRRDRSHALVDAVTRGDDDESGQDSNSNIADRITGNIRRRENAPEDTSMTPTPMSSTPMRSGNDPLRGLD